MKSGKIAMVLSTLLTAGALTIGGAQAVTTSEAAKNAVDPVVLIQTTKGPIHVRVFQKEAPKTAGNFLDLVNKHFYDGVTFHRVEPGFVIQGGDPTGTGSGNYKDPKTHHDRLIPLEKVPGLNHDSPGVLAMARTNDPNSASCQFYITLNHTEFLDNPPGYAVFGKVLDGMEVVQKIRRGDKMTKVSVVK